MTFDDLNKFAAALLKENTDLRMRIKELEKTLAAMNLKQSNYYDRPN